jgi:tetrahydromethanopterin S-methyltransferase subunit G
MFGLKKRLKSLEHKLGLVYSEDDDFDYHAEVACGSFNDIEARLNKLEDKFDEFSKGKTIK